MSDGVIKEIGGRNLIYNAENPTLTPYGGSSTQKENGIIVSEWNANNAIRVTTTGGSDMLKGYISMSPANLQGLGYTEPMVVTESIYIKNNSNQPMIVRVNGSDNSINVGANEVKKIVISFRVTVNISLQIQFHAQSASDNLDFTFWHPKIEIGSTATRWTPSPDFIQDSMFYRSGDTMSLSGLVADGFITEGATSMLITIPCGKRLDFVSSASLSNEKVQVRQNGNYLIGSSSSGVSFDGTFTFYILRDIGCIRLDFKTSAAVPNATNNDLVAVQFYTGTITFS